MSSSRTPPPAYSPGFTGAVPKPSSPRPAAHSHSDMFPQGHWRDLWAAILFYIQFFAVLGLTGYSSYYLYKHGGDFGPLDGKRPKRPPAVPSLHLSSLAVPLGILSGMALTATLLSCLVLVFAKRAPQAAIRLAFFTNVLMYCILAVFEFASGNSWQGLFMIIIAIVTVICLFAWRRHIPLSAEILKSTVQVLDAYPAMLLVVFGGAAAQVVYLGAIGVSAYGLLKLLADRVIQSGAFSAIMLSLVFSVFWTAQVIANTVLTTIAGVYATFYFISGAVGQRVSNPTVKSLGRALTWSFGSICFGSLIVAAIQFLRFLIDQFRERDDLAGAIANCLLQILEDLVQYFNYYAYIHVAIYGKPYTKAASDVWRLIKGNGVLSIINDNLIGTFCVMASLSISAGTAIFSYLLAYLFKIGKDERDGVAFGGWLTGLMVSMVVLEIVKSGSTTTMVCLAEDPGALQRTKPALYQKLATAYSRIFYNWQYP